MLKKGNGELNQVTFSGLDTLILGRVYVRNDVILLGDALPKKGGTHSIVFMCTKEGSVHTRSRAVYIFKNEQVLFADAVFSNDHAEYLLSEHNRNMELSITYNTRNVVDASDSEKAEFYNMALGKLTRNNHERRIFETCMQIGIENSL